METESLKKTKNSRQRDLVLRILRSSKDHPTAESIYREARKTMPSISLGTVYRNLNHLRDEGRIRELSYGKGISHFDGELREHHHLRCLSCGSVEDVPCIIPKSFTEEVQAQTRFRIHSARLEFIGICGSCEETAVERKPEQDAGGE
ncbi:transcriptional repressor [bacterium]|nr:transcriptional repressor [bacterium]